MPPDTDNGPRQRLWRIRAKQVVLATGAIERPLVLCNNDRPGIMLASGISDYIHRYRVLPGSRAVVFTNNDSAYRTAFDLLGAGAQVEAIVDSRPAGRRSAEARERGLQVLNRRAVVDVRGTKRIRGVRLMALSADGRSVSGKRPPPGVRPPGRVRRLEPNRPASRPVRRPARLQRRESLLRFRARRCRRSGRRGPAGGVSISRPCLAEGFRAGAAAAHAAGRGDGHLLAAHPQRGGQGRRPDPAALDRPGRQTRLRGPPSSSWIPSWTSPPPTS